MGKQGEHATIGTILLWGTGFFLLYWWLIGETQVQQLIAGGIIGMGTALAQELLRRRCNAHFAFLPREMGIALWRACKKIPFDIGLLFIALFSAAVGGKRARGQFLEVSFRPGRQDSAGASRRTLLITAISTAPNTFVITDDEAKRTILAHQLVPRPQCPDEEWPLL